MLKHVKLSKHKALKEQDVVLNDLGHINVICGKNNGGKSTILEAVSFLNKDISIATAGKFIDKEYFINKISTSFRFINSDYKNYMLSFFDTVNNKTYFSNEDGKFLSEINNWCSTRRFVSGLSSDALGFTDYFKEENSIKSEIISPKRKFDYKTNLASVYNPQNESKSTNIIKKLHMMKNAGNRNDKLTYEKIKSNFSKITHSDFDIVQLDVKIGETELIELRFNYDSNWFNGENCGMGFSDILFILFFTFVSDNNLVLIEEPENHLHSELQKRMLYFFTEQNDKQFILTTHSNIFLDTLLVNSIYYTEIQKGKLIVNNKTSKSEILQRLGYSVSDNLVSDLILFVEGPTDIPVIRTILIWMNIEQQHNIRYLPLCGDFMNHIDLKAFADKSNVMVLVDRDPKPGSDKQRKKLLEKCKEIGLEAHRLEKYAIENYFTLEALKQVFKGQIKPDITSIDESKSLEEQLGIYVKDNNQKIISLMKESDLCGTDLYEFCNRIKKIVTNHS